MLVLGQDPGNQPPRYSLLTFTKFRMAGLHCIYRRFLDSETTVSDRGQLKIIPPMTCRESYADLQSNELKVLCDFILWILIGGQTLDENQLLWVLNTISSRR